MDKHRQQKQTQAKAREHKRHTQANIKANAEDTIAKTKASSSKYKQISRQQKAITDKHKGKDKRKKQTNIATSSEDRNNTKEIQEKVNGQSR